jgi:glycosyltransferase involved in cell wall biosynthesis
MRILLVHPRMSVMGGGERVAIHSIKEALREGHEVYLATEEFDVDSFEDFFGVEGLFRNIRLLTYRPFRPIIRKAVLYQRLIYHQSRLRKIVSKRRAYDLILNTAEVANQPSARLPAIEYCYFPDYFSHLESDGPSGLWETYYWPARVFYHNRVSHVDRLLAVSDFTRQFVRERWRRESTTLYPPCPIDLYDNIRIPKQNLVITVGRMAPEKRMGLFLEMARKLPNVEFAIVGSVATERRFYFDSLRASAPSNVSFIMSPLRKVKELLGKAKVYVHCAQNEHFGITIVEAMAAGCVPVVNDSGGPREIVSDDVGYRWNRIDEAVRQISNLIDDEALRRELSKAATSRARQFGPDEFESGLGKVLREYAK